MSSAAFARNSDTGLMSVRRFSRRLARRMVRLSVPQTVHTLRAGAVPIPCVGVATATSADERVRRYESEYPSACHALRHRIIAVPVAMKLQQRVAIGVRRVDVRVDEARHLVEHEVEVVLRVLLADHLKCLTVDRELRDASEVEIDARVALGAQLLRELEERGVNIDRSLPHVE